MPYWRMAKPRPDDFMQNAKLIGDIATGQSVDVPRESLDEKVRAYMSALGKIGGKKGGKARKRALSKKRRIEIARLGAKVRWSSKKK